MLHSKGVMAVLAVHYFLHVGVTGQDPDAADGPVMGFSGIHEPVQVHGLVGAVEAAYSEVDDALCQP